MSRCRDCDNKLRTARGFKPLPKRQPKPCRLCGGMTESAKRWYCDACREARRKERANRPNRAMAKTASRGYGGSHQKERVAWSGRVASGTVRCARGEDCVFAENVDGVRVGGLIDPRTPWDLDHSDDRNTYLGPSHRRCNRRSIRRRT